MSPSTQAPFRFRWQPNKGVVAFVVVFLPVTLALGVWQLERAGEKRRLLDTWQARRSAAPVALATLDPAGDHQYRRVRVEGRYLNDKTLLLDGRIRGGRPGYEVITAFQPTGDGRRLWVNRGWIPGSLDRSQLPDVPAVADRRNLTGHLYRSPGEPFSLGEAPWRNNWPQVWQHLDIGRLDTRLAGESWRWRLRLEQGAPGALETGWDTVTVLPARHIGYAVQWFALAGALLLLGLFANSNLGALFKRNKESPADE